MLYSRKQKTRTKTGYNIEKRLDEESTMKACKEKKQNMINPL